ncbi:MAG: hypothetical protein ACR2IQ_02610 [Minisyncoccia bacterium]
MVFSDTTNRQGIVQEIDFLVNSDNNSYPIEDKTRNVNRAYDKAVSLILQADGRWEFDDQNATDLPIATTDLVSGQQDYSFDPTFLIVSRVEVKDSNGNWTALSPFSQADIVRGGIPGYIPSQSLTDFLSQPGIPQYYDKLANSIFLYPKPSYSQDASLKVYFQRNVSYFTPTDTTKQPGFSNMFHRLLSMSAAMDYAQAKNLDLLRNQPFVLELAQMWADLQSYYTRKAKDENLNMHIRKWKWN